MLIDMWTKSVTNCIEQYIYIFFIKLVYLLYRGAMVSFAQGGAGVPFPPYLSSQHHFLSLLPDLPVVVGGRRRVYA